MRSLLERSAEREHAIDGLARRHLHRQEPRSADRQRAGLVEQHGVRPRQRLERSAALDQDTAPCRLRDAGDESNGSRQDQRARGCCDEHGEATDQVARNQPGEHRNAQGNWQKEQRVAIGEPHERRLGGLRSGHQPHDSRICALAGGGGRGQFECLACIQRAGQDADAADLDDGDRLACQRRLVNSCSIRSDDAIDRNDLARAHHEAVARDNCRNGYILDMMIAPSVRLARRSINQ
jgi:hypothetical protein